MNQAQAFNELDYGVYGYLSTGEENKSGSYHEQIHKITKDKKYNFVEPLPSNKNQQRSMPIIIINQLCKPQYEITNSIDDRLENFIVKCISKVLEVEYILLSKIEDYYEIWTVINKLDREVRERIYDIEFNILRRFKALYFDFHVICRNDRDFKDFFSSNTKIIFQRMA
jgi:hypothetical protein